MQALIVSVCAAFAVLSATAASAAPAIPAEQLRSAAANQSPIVNVRDFDQERRHRKWKRHDRRHHHHYDRRYDRYRGWHRYSHRPHRWRDRGCVVVGPIWFCP
ncbi:MAG TPA: hypothetical protein PKD49_07180 [Hyphomicrobium sp.]|nr:hypothetical protein [Hyphomicrobium sp.]